MNKSPCFSRCVLAAMQRRRGIDHNLDRIFFSSRSFAARLFRALPRAVPSARAWPRGYATHRLASGHARACGGGGGGGGSESQAALAAGQRQLRWWWRRRRVPGGVGVGGDGDDCGWRLRVAAAARVPRDSNRWRQPRRRLRRRLRLVASPRRRRR